MHKSKISKQSANRWIFGASKIEIVKDKDKDKFNILALHPLQSWEWGEFRKRTGVEVIRLGKYENDDLIETAQITIHPLPFTPLSVGYFPKGNTPSREMLKKLIEVGKLHRCIFIKLEPNVANNGSKFPITNYQLPILLSSHPLFTKYTFQLDLTQDEENLLKIMHPKTRYNIKVAQKHKVTVMEDHSHEAFEKYLELTFETARRQKFHAHTSAYHKLLWETLKNQKFDNNVLSAHLLTAIYKPQSVENQATLATWIVFLFHKTLYYPYGASSNEYRNTMASTLMMWETIRYGKTHGATIFDMWGALGPDPDPSDSWYGFHRFKQGFGAKLVELVGSYDLVINPVLYRMFCTVHKLREIYWKIIG